MSKRYSGALITKTPVVPTSLSAPGIWSLSDQAAAQATNTWPFPRDPQFKNVTMLLHGDGSAGAVSATGVGAGVSTTVTNFNADASTNNFNVTINGDARSNNFTPYQGNGYYSNYFDGSSAYLSVATNAGFGMGTGDCTLECWYFPLNSTVGIQTLIDIRTTNTGVPVVIGVLSSGAPYAYNGTTYSGSTVTNNSWNHIAFVRNGSGTNNCKLYLNGTQVTQFTDTADWGSTDTCAIGRNTGTAAEYALGYISNARVVKGTAVYTAAFTPSTTPLTAVSGTSLLTCQSNRFVDNSASPLTITVNGSPQVSPAVPFTLPSSVATYGSGYFDGTGDYLTELTATTALNLSSGDWSISFWVYKTATANGSIVNLYNSAGNTSGLSIWIGSGGVKVDNGVSGGVQAGTVVVNAWSYIEVIRSSGTTTIYVNGVSAGTTTQTPNASQFGSFGSAADGTLPHQGYITDLRIVKGTALSSSVPTSPVTAVSGTSLLTTQYNGGGNNSGFKDSSQNNFVITRNGNTTQGTFTPYGSNWSNYFNGTDAYWKQASSTNYTFGTSDFTIECWINLNSTSTQMRRIFGVGYGGNGGSHGCTWDLRYQGTESPTGQISFGRYDGTTDTTFSTSGATINVGQWYHIAVSRTGGNLRIFVDGVAYYNAANSINYSVVTYGGNTELWTGLGYYGPAGGLGGPRYFGGYMSNIRIINGTGIYSSTFTPSTTPLTAITSTQLLTAQSNRFVDNSTNAQAITPFGSVSVQRFSPFAPLTVYNPTTYGGSGYFDGTGDYLTVPINAAFNLGTNSFTIECWYYSLGSTSYQEFIGAWGTTVSNSAFLLGMNGTNLFFQVAYGGNQVSFQPTLPPNYQWNHIAMVSNGSTLSAFLNGARVGTQAFSSSINSVSYTPAIGYRVSASGYPFLGYIASPRIVNGSAVYDPTLTTCTVPTAPLSVVTNTSLLANMTNPAILDNSMLNDLETVGNAAVSTSVKKYGAASMYFDGSGDWLMTPNRTNLNVGSGDFTVEAWVYTGSTSQQVIIGANRNSDGVGAFMLNLNYTGKVRFFCSYSGGTILDYNVGSGTISDSAWHHIAVTRSGSSLRIFIDGTQTGTTNTTLGTASIDNAIADYRVGSTTDGALNFNGYIDDLRITKGVARYTANFTVPDQAFPNG